MNDNMIRLPGHPILGVGDLVHYDASFAATCPSRSSDSCRRTSTGATSSKFSS